MENTLQFDSEGRIILPQSINEDIKTEQKAKSKGMSLNQYKRYLIYGTTKPLFFRKKSKAVREVLEEERERRGL